MLKNKKLNRLFIIASFGLFMFVAIFLLANLALAANSPDLGLSYAEGTGLSNALDIRVIIARIIRIILGFLGILAVGLIIFAGWIWMTSAGNEEKIGQAKKILTNAVIGLIIVLSAFAITSYILNQLMGVGNGNNFPNQPGGSVGGGGITALGSSIISSHYPERNQKDVARNTKIVITFKEAIDPATIINGANINTNNIKIYKTQDGITGAVTFDVQAKKSDDNKTFVFKPSQYLGSPTEKIWYSVALGKDIKKANGDSAFSGVIGAIAYDWMFEVGTFVDTSPPKVVSIIPAPSATEPRNVVVQINFSEAVDPISASGAFKAGTGFQNIKVTDKDSGSTIEGNFYASNQYKTVEFLTFEACGTNSCGNTIYCLPANKDIKAIIKAATFDADTNLAVFPYNGVVDLADNSFDGNGNDQAEGPLSDCDLAGLSSTPVCTSAGDNAFWIFSTNNTIDLAPPNIISVDPPVGGSGVDLSAKPSATFNKLLMSSTLNSSSVNFRGASSTISYWVTKADDFTAGRTTANINHEQFNEDANYKIQFNSGIKDIYQNCFTPCSGVGVGGNPVVGNPSCCNGVPSTGSSCP
jgi:hypothetical protein